MVTTFKNKIEALEYLEKEVGSHVMISGELADSIGEPFGVKFDYTTFYPQLEDPKGVLPNMNEDGSLDMEPFTAVSSFVISSKIANSVGAMRNSFMGRGFQFRADIQAAREVIDDNS
jgi:hypothetical protein|tara:strand:- start:25 stop:375 length:351 start_codon:yes stop_codon:yes gene_type:complete